jgi:acyl dehydratase
VEDMKKRIGEVHTSERKSLPLVRNFQEIARDNTQITRDSIRHFGDAIGDLNPLYCDREYAKKTKYGCFIAPPATPHNTRGYKLVQSQSNTQAL